MEILNFVLHWSFLGGVIVGWLASPFINKLVSKIKK